MARYWLGDVLLLRGQTHKNCQTVQCRHRTDVCLAGVGESRRWRRLGGEGDRRRRRAGLGDRLRLSGEGLRRRRGESRSNPLSR